MPMPYNANFLKGNKSTTTGTYGEDEVLMPQAKANILPAIVGIEVQHPKMSNLADKYSKWHLSIKSQDDVQDLDDEDVVAKGQRDAGTNAAPVNVEDPIERIIFPAPIPISFDKLWFGFKQDTGSTHTYRYNLIWVPRYLKGVQQRNNLVNQTQF